MIVQKVCWKCARTGMHNMKEGYFLNPTVMRLKLQMKLSYKFDINKDAGEYGYLLTGKT
jgi:hypothetical protein